MIIAASVFAQDPPPDPPAPVDPGLDAPPPPPEDIEIGVSSNAAHFDWPADATAKQYMVRTNS